MTELRDDKADPPLQPMLEGRWIRLRTVRNSDMDWLYHLSTGGDVSFRWRYRGETPSPPTFSRLLWEGVVTQYIAESKESSRPFGLLAAYHVDDRNRHGYVAVLFDQEHRSKGWPLESCALFIQYLFDVFPFRKLYFESLDFNVEQFGSGLQELLIEEGRLRGHAFHGGKYADMVTLALYRETWDLAAGPILRSLNGNIERA